MASQQFSASRGARPAPAAPFTAPAECQFEIIGHLAITDSPLSDANLHALDEQFCCQSAEGHFDVEVSHLADGTALLDRIDSYVRYGHSAWESFLVSSKDPLILSQLHKFQPALRTGLILAPDSRASDIISSLEKLHSLRIDCIITPFRLLRKVLKARKNYPGIDVFVRFADSLRQAVSSREYGADGAVTRRPFHIREAFESTE